MIIIHINELDNIKDIKGLTDTELFKMGIIYDIVEFNSIIGSKIIYNSMEGNIINCKVVKAYIATLIVQFNNEKKFRKFEFHRLEDNIRIKIIISKNIRNIIKLKLNKLIEDRNIIKFFRKLITNNNNNLRYIRALKKYIEDNNYSFLSHKIRSRSYLNKNYVYLFDYYPDRLIDSENFTLNDKNNRRKIFDFKNGYKFEDMANNISELIKIYFNNKDRNEIYFIPIPASTGEKHDRRYKKFCKKVSEITGVINGNGLAKNKYDRKSIHSETNGTFSIDNIRIDRNVRGKKVVLFDDIITTGNQFKKITKKIEKHGGKVIMGMFLGETVRGDS
ncbi:MAG: phosphoribosyltransferase [bacterium]